MSGLTRWPLSNTGKKGRHRLRNSTLSCLTGGSARNAYFADMDDAIAARNETCTPKRIVPRTTILDPCLPARLIALEDNNC